MMSEGRVVFFKKTEEISATRHSSFVTCRSTRAFTLVEMLIVVAIIATLMTIVFRLGGAGGEDSRRTETVVTLQRIENSLSGYYAAFGSYPPVKVMGSRDIYCKVDENGDQDTSGGGNMNQKENGEALVWAQVNAACRSQPFGCEYPGDEQDNEVIEAWTGEIAERVGNSQDYPNYASGKYAYAGLFQQNGEITGPNPGEGFGSEWNNSDWKSIKLFKFGMMSFLLPRYLFMMGGDEQFFGIGGNNACAQWDDNNDMPCDPFEGKSFDESEDGWETIRNYAQTGNQGTIDHNQLARIANIPSQAVCARWMPNLEHTCRTLRTMTFFGVQVSNPDHTGLGLDDEYPPDPGTHNPPAGGKPYKNAFVTILDGWDREYYYYSPAPYQSYAVWSAGSNGKTFPPWMSVESLNSSERETATKWKSDDIMQMSH